ncbi:MAG: uroporphyrinogen-III C-methyltransferase [Alphaproteobacteria bacterium]|nr:uroporphyrinogen-III C-methyltransferase [Alphaproteobacteria bacterium]
MTRPAVQRNRLKFFPLAFAVAGRPVVVIGNGERALQKLRLLARSEARLVCHAEAPNPALRAFLASEPVDWVPARPARLAPSAAALVFVATDDPADDAALAAMARAARIPVNVVDRADLSDFTVPAIVDRAPIAVAISTDGTSPVLAQRLRAAIEAMLAPGLGRVAELADALRGTVARRLSDSVARRRFWMRLFDGPAGDAALAGDAARARRLAIQALARESATTPDGKVFLVGAGPGAEDLLTLRAQRLLQEADAIVHDDLVPAAVIDMGRRDATRHAVGKRKGRHSATQEDINDLLVRLAREGRRVVRLKAGDPAVFGRAGEEIAAVRAAGIDVEIVPGITAALAAAADVGASLTRRGTASCLVVATGHGAEQSEPGGWEAAAANGATVALYMGRSVAGRVAARAIAAGLAPDTPVAAVENAGRTDRRILAGTLSDLPALAVREEIAGPVMILIGEALAAADLAAAEQLAVRRRQIAQGEFAA